MRTAFLFRIAFLCVVLLYCKTVFTQTLEEKPAWNDFFAAEKIQGVLVLCKNTSVTCITNSKSRANTAYLPASTFKIPNALIALELGIIESQHQVFKWDGKSRSLKQWEKDFNLRGAMQASAVPVFQQFAREIGENRMKNFLHRFAYGNENLAGGIDRFWLDGGLRISALQQIIFLEKLFQDRLPFSKYNQLMVKDAMISDATSTHLLRSKTGYTLGAPGYGDKSQTGIAWWVGWIEKETEVYFFAINIDVSDEKQLSARKSLATKILVTEKIL
jgi:beta-lactamase class D OXA-10